MGPAGGTARIARSLDAIIGQHSETMPRPGAMTWVYMTALVAWAQDHGLIGPWLRPESRAAREEYAALDGAGGMRGWLARAIASLAVHPGTWTLLDPAWVPALRGARPPERACRDLAAWWDTAPLLAFGVTEGPGSLSGWTAGDLLQALSEERRKRHALVQTPWWVADFILDLTLIPACAESGQGDEPVRLIDPACGTGHFLIRAIDYLHEWYTTGALAPRQAKGAEPATGGTPLPPAEAIRRIIAGVHGCDIDPLTAAVARLRYTVAIGDLMRRAGIITGQLRLDRIPRFQVPVIPGDSLLARTPGFTREDYARVHPGLAAIVNLGMPESRPLPPRQLNLPGTEPAAAGTAA
jgi:hypothetical protein